MPQPMTPYEAAHASAPDRPSQRRPAVASRYVDPPVHTAPHTYGRALSDDGAALGAARARICSASPGRFLGSAK